MTKFVVNFQLRHFLKYVQLFLLKKEAQASECLWAAQTKTESKNNSSKRNTVTLDFITN